MPSYPWLEATPLKMPHLQAQMRSLQRFGVPYSDQQIAAAPSEIDGKTEMEAMIAYLQSLGIALKDKRS
jgi:cytochrome c oxidase cbb3-type subunit 2